MTRRLDWKLVFMLSMFGLAMAIAIPYVPAPLDPAFAGLWIVIFVADAGLIARRAPGMFFLHGFLAGFANWIWVSGAHIVYFDAMPHQASQTMTVTTSPGVIGWL